MNKANGSGLRLHHSLLAFTLIVPLGMNSGPGWAAENIQLLAEATQAYAGCVAAGSLDTTKREVSVEARVQVAFDSCAALRQRVVEALSPIERSEYMETIDRDIGVVAREFATKSTSERP